MPIPLPVRAAWLALALASGSGLMNAVALSPQAAPPQQPPPTTVGSEADRAAAHAAVDAFVKAFQARDSNAMAAIWTSGGEIQNAEGLTVRGRDSISKGFSTLFSRTPEISAQIQPTFLHFLSKDVAVEEGTVAVRKGVGQSPGKATYSALIVRENGAWRLARLHETPAPAPTIQDLAWIIGEWQSAAGENAQITTTYEWAPSKKFIHARFTFKSADRSLSGSQVIGVDPATGNIHTWSFEADGGIGEAEWTPDGDHWVLDATGTLADGKILSETNILRKINDNTFTWQSIERILEAETLPDLPPVKVVRVKPAS